MTVAKGYDWPIHPIAELFPMMQGQAFEDLVADIRENGLEVPIMLDSDGRVIDGRNRLRACWIAGVDPMTDVFDGPDVTKFVISHNLHRRHLTDAQRAMVAAKLAERTVGQRDHLVPLTSSKSEVADLLGVSRTSVTRAKAIIRDGVPELADLVSNDQVPVNTASRVAQLPAREQEEFVSKVKEGVKPSEAAPPPAPRNKGVASPKVIEIPVKRGHSPGRTGSRRTHVQMIEALIAGLEGYGYFAVEINAADPSNSRLDQSVTAEEAARLRGGLSKAIQPIQQIANLLHSKEITR